MQKHRVIGRLAVEIWLQVHEHRLVTCLHTLHRRLIALESSRLFVGASCVRIITTTCVKDDVVLKFRLFGLLAIQVSTLLSRLLTFVEDLLLLRRLLVVGRTSLLHPEFLCDEAVLNYLVNILTFAYCLLIVEIK